MATIGRVEFDGVSTETKPSALPGGGDLPAGGRFIEADTGREFYWTGTAWALLRADVTTSTTATDQLAAQLETNALLRELLAETMATRMALQETYNDGRADQTDFRELAATNLTDLADTEGY